MTNNTLLTGSDRDEYIKARFPSETPTTESTVTLKEQQDYDTWYESKNPSYQLMIDVIAERTTSIIEEEDYDEFIEELANYGINEPEEFEDRFNQEVEGYGERVFAEFSEELVESCGYNIEPEFIRHCIDWELVWYSSLRYDYQAVEFKGNTYFFNNN